MLSYETYGTPEPKNPGFAPFRLEEDAPKPAWCPRSTYGAVATQCLKTLCDSVGFSPEQRDASVALLLDLISPWATLPIGTCPTGFSDITDEHFPIEFSLALENGVPEVRVLFEAQGTRFSQRELWAAGWAVCEKLEKHYGISLERLRKVSDLFEPTSPTCTYALWHGVCFSPSATPKFKIYLNPLAQGAEHGPAVISESLARLGFTSAIQDVFLNAERNCEFRFFSLDLSDSPDARVKVYRVHYNATREEIEAALRVVPGYSQELVDQFWSEVAGPEDRFSRLPVSTYLSLNSRHPRPSTATIHFPVRSYSDTDLEVACRVQAFLTPEELMHYTSALENFATRPLRSGVGLQSYVSVRLHSGPRHVTIYLSPEAYYIEPPRESGPIRMAS